MTSRPLSLGSLGAQRVEAQATVWTDILRALLCRKGLIEMPSAKLWFGRRPVAVATARFGDREASAAGSSESVDRCTAHMFILW